MYVDLTENLWRIDNELHNLDFVTVLLSFYTQQIVTKKMKFDGLEKEGETKITI